MTAENQPQARRARAGHLPNAPPLANLAAQTPWVIAEDECLIAMDLADIFETAGANVIGPASTVQEALNLLTSEKVDRACLDFNLADGEVTPVLELLASKGIPMVVYRGRGLPKELISQHPRLTVLHKPLPAKRLVKELAKAKAN